MYKRQHHSRVVRRRSGDGHDTLTLLAANFLARELIGNFVLGLAASAFGDETKTGKPVGDDLREAKPTVLLARARATASPEQLEVLDRVGPDITDHEVESIQTVMIETGAVGACEREIAELLEEATAALDLLPDVNGSRDALEALADFVVSRDG